MHTEDGHVHLDEEEASGGSKEGVVRWVLLFGLLLAVLLMSVVWIVPALTSNEDAIAPHADAAAAEAAAADEETTTVPGE